MSSRSSTTESDSLPDRVVVGRIRRPHGLRGAVLVDRLSDVPARFAPGSRLTARGPRGTSEVEVAYATDHSGVLRVGFRGMDDREAVDGLRGAELLCDRQDSPGTADDSFYYYELVGCACRDRVHGELGRVVEIVEDGGGALLRLEDESRGILVPLARAYVAEVLVDERRVELTLPEGFLESCAYRS